jgi:CRP/FNR family transcriptional regulator
MKKEKHISEIPLFNGLEEKHIKSLAGIAVERLFKRGALIFSEGDDSTGFYVIISGRVKIYKVSPEGKEQILHIFGSGDPFGEVPVFTGQPFPAYAESITDSQIFIFPRESFVSLIRKEPSLALNMLSILSMRLKKFTSLIEDLSLKEVPGRLAAYLILMSERGSHENEITLEISKGQLASILGTIPETLSRILARLIKEGFIKSEGKRKILIKDREGLEELALGERKLA